MSSHLVQQNKTTPRTRRVSESAVPQMMLDFVVEFQPGSCATSQTIPIVLRAKTAHERESWLFMLQSHWKRIMQESLSVTAILEHQTNSMPSTSESAITHATTTTGDSSSPINVFKVLAAEDVPALVLPGSVQSRHEVHVCELLEPSPVPSEASLESVPSVRVLENPNAANYRQSHPEKALPEAPPEQHLLDIEPVFSERASSQRASSAFQVSPPTSSTSIPSSSTSNSSSPEVPPKSPANSQEETLMQWYTSVVSRKLHYARP
jgi:hypothetical protein